jgi:hypothetical protein
MHLLIKKYSLGSFCEYVALYVNACGTTLLGHYIDDQQLAGWD